MQNRGDRAKARLRGLPWGGRGWSPEGDLLGLICLCPYLWGGGGLQKMRKRRRWERLNYSFCLPWYLLPKIRVNTFWLNSNFNAKDTPMINYTNFYWRWWRKEGKPHPILICHPGCPSLLVLMFVNKVHHASDLPVIGFAEQNNRSASPTANNRSASPTANNRSADMADFAN